MPSAGWAPRPRRRLPGQPEAAGNSRAQSGGERSPRSRRDLGRAAAALCCIAAAHKGGGGGGPGLGVSGRAGGLRHAFGAALSQPLPPPPPRAHKEARERRTWPRRLQRRRLPARAAGSSLARRPRQHNRRAGAVQGSCAAPRRLAGVVVRARARARAAQGRPRRTDYMSRPRRRRAAPRPARPQLPALPTRPLAGPARGARGGGAGRLPSRTRATLEPRPARSRSLLHSPLHAGTRTGGRISRSPGKRGKGGKAVSTLESLPGHPEASLKPRTRTCGATRTFLEPVFVNKPRA